MSKPKAYVSEAKKTAVKELKKLFKEYPVIGIVNLENLPSQQLQKMRHQLRGKMLILTAKGRLIKIAIKGITEKEGFEKLEEHIKGMPAIIFTNEDPFKLYKALQKSKSAAAAKPGQKAPNDLVISAGPTSFAPGPIISEFGSMGIKTAIEDGKIVIKADKVVAKEGDVINEKTASLLAKMGIEPMEIGLNLIAVYENGTIFTKDVLAIDEKEYIDNIKRLSSESMALAMHISYATKDTIRALLSKAYRETKALADSHDILTKDNVKDILAKAERQGSALKAHVKD
ncbi:MAG: 50S ribosomal protein L10 [Candidatus Woesearchaeota archaeon]